MNDKKYKAVVAVWGILLLILQVASLVNIITKDIGGSIKFVSIALAVFLLGMILAYLILSLFKKKAGPIVGIVIGSLYVLSFGVVNILIGVCFIVSCSEMLVDLNKDKRKAKTEN